MRKIPTLLIRDAADRRYVTEEITPGCEWVLAGEGDPTRKYDGTCVLAEKHHTPGAECRWSARREVRAGKTPPPMWVEVAVDPATGKRMGWEPIEQSPFAKFHAEALRTAEGLREGTYELCGPKINGNPEGFSGHRLVRHADAERLPVAPGPLTVGGAVDMVRAAAQRGWEGIVWHHPDGQMAKLKARDLPRTRDKDGDT